MASFNPAANAASQAPSSSDPVLLSSRVAQAAADLQVQKLHLLFGILMRVDGFPEAPLLREVGHNGNQLLGDAVGFYRHAIAQAQEGRA